MHDDEIQIKKMIVRVCTQRRFHDRCKVGHLKIVKFGLFYWHLFINLYIGHVLTFPKAESRFFMFHK